MDAASQNEPDRRPEPTDGAGGAPSAVPDRHAEAGADRARQTFLDRDEQDEEVEHPTKLLRIAHSIRSLLDEVRTTELDEAGRERLADIHERAVSQLQELVSDNLGEELGAMRLEEELPSGGELRVAQAQLAGWLEGLFRGIQASMASQQRAALVQERRQGGAPGVDGSTGQYL